MLQVNVTLYSKDFVPDLADVYIKYSSNIQIFICREKKPKGQPRSKETVNFRTQQDMREKI